MDLPEILADKGIGFKPSNTHLILNNCPECGGSNKLYIKKDNGLWICFKCHSIDEDMGKGGPYALLSLLGFAPNEIKDILGSNTVHTYSDDFDFKVMAPMEELGRNEELEAKVFPTHFFPLLCDEEDYQKFPEAYNYLLSRGIKNLNLIKHYNLHYSPAQKRIIFPIYREKKELVGWQGRDITERCRENQFKCLTENCDLRGHWYFKGEFVPEGNICPSCGIPLTETEYPKTLNSYNFKKQLMLANQHIINWEKPVVLVEGPFDSINTPNSIPLLGKFLSDYQAKILRKKAKKLLLYFDGDSEGSKSTKDVYRELELFVDSIGVVYCEDDSDPGQYSWEENLKRISEPLSLEQWAVRKNLLV